MSIEELTQCGSPGSSWSVLERTLDGVDESWALSPHAADGNESTAPHLFAGEDTRPTDAFSAPSIFVSSQPHVKRKEPRASHSTSLSVPTNPFAQWGTLEEELEWVGNHMYADPTGASMLSGSEVLAAAADQRTLCSGGNIARWRRAQIIAVAAEDDGVRFLGKQHLAAKATISVVWDAVALADRRHVGVSKVALYCVYQSLRFTVLAVAQEAAHDDDAAAFADAVLSRVFSSAAPMQFDPDFCIGATSKPPDNLAWVTESQVYARLSAELGVTGADCFARRDAWRAPLPQVARAHLLADTGPVGARFATPEGANVCSHMVRVFCYRFVAVCVFLDAQPGRAAEHQYTRLACAIAGGA